MDVIRGIYCIENLVNKKKYVGQSSDIYRRWKDHKNELNGHRHHNVHLQRAWDKYGEDGFSFYVLEECDDFIMDDREIYYIAHFRCMDNEFGYNLETGGGAHKKPSYETRIKMSEAKKDKYYGGDNPKAHPVYCPQLDRWFECIMDVQREGIACEVSVRNCLTGKHHTAGKHPVTGEKLTWYDENDMNSQDMMKIIEDEKNGISHVSPNPRIIPLYCPELDRIFDGGATQVEREGIVGRSTIQGYLSGRRKSAGKHPITNEPLTWKRINNNT